MRATRNILVAMALAGFAFAMWYARPSEVREWTGWLFALFVSSVWLVVIVICLVAPGLGRPFTAIGAVLVLSASELLIYFKVTDPWFLLLKPFAQAFAAALGAVIGFPFDRRAMTPNTPLERAREG